MKILIIRLGRIGDMILSTPLLSQLKQNITGIEIDILASKDNHKILDFDENVDNIYILNKNPLKLFSLILKLRKKNYDIIFDPKDHYSTETYYLAGLIKTEKRIGFKHSESSIFDIDVSEFNKDKVHFQDRILSALKAFGIKPDFEIRVPLNYPNYNVNEKKKKSDYIIVNISASNDSKSIPFETAKYILLKLKQEGIKTFLISSPNDIEIVDKLCQQTGTDRAITNSITDTFEYIHLAKALISSDTSLVHIAGTYNTPVLVFSKSLDKELVKFAPKSDVNIVVKSNSSESILLSREEVYNAIDRLLVSIN